MKKITISSMDKRDRRLMFRIVLSPLRPILWLMDRTYGVLFGWLDARASRSSERQLERELRQSLPFLFTSYGSVVIQNINVPFPEPFDYATVTVACHNLLIQFVRGRGELDVALAQSKAPHEWHDLLLVLAAINGSSELPERRWIYDLKEAATLLEPNMARLYDAFGCDSDGEIVHRLEEFHKADRASMREWEFEINSRLR